VWLDTYGSATCVEYLGIGIYGNRITAPHVNADELGRALMVVVGDGSERARLIRHRAEDLGEICQESRGTQVACDVIMEFVEVQTRLG
jgi:hypothetical protein